MTIRIIDSENHFDFATKYYYSHTLNDWSNFTFSEVDFQDFLKFLKENEFEYETETEKEFAEALRKAKADHLDKEIEESYNQLMAVIDKAKEKVLVDKKLEITTLLKDEILKRYFYREGMYNYHLVNSPEILEAVLVLNDTKRYNKILK